MKRVRKQEYKIQPRGRCRVTPRFTRFVQNGNRLTRRQLRKNKLGALGKIQTGFSKEQERRNSKGGTQSLRLLQKCPPPSIQNLKEAECLDPSTCTFGSEQQERRSALIALPSCDVASPKVLLYAKTQLHNTAFETAV